MNASINYLVSILQQEIAVCENVFELLQKKEKILIKNNHVELKKVFSEEHQLFLKTRELESSRQSILEVIGRNFQFSGTHPTLLVLAEKMEESVKERLLSLRKNFLEQIELIKKQNQKCEILLKKSLEIVGYSIKLLSIPVVQKNKMLYQKDRHYDRKHYPKSIIDQKG